MDRGHAEGREDRLAPSPSANFPLSTHSRRVYFGFEQHTAVVADAQTVPAGLWNNHHQHLFEEGIVEAAEDNEKNSEGTLAPLSRYNVERGCCTCFS